MARPTTARKPVPHRDTLVPPPRRVNLRGIWRVLRNGNGRTPPHLNATSETMEEISTRHRRTIMPEWPRSSSTEGVLNRCPPRSVPTERFVCTTQPPIHLAPSPRTGQQKPSSNPRAQLIGTDSRGIFGEYATLHLPGLRLSRPHRTASIRGRGILRNLLLVWFRVRRDR